MIPKCIRNRKVVLLSIYAYATWIFMGGSLLLALQDFTPECYDLFRTDAPADNTFLPRRSLLSEGLNCTDDSCGNGTCNKVGECECTRHYVTTDKICDYKLQSQLLIFLLSFFVGGFGVNWFVLI